MTIAIKLDANAVSSLFSTPEAKLELQQSVIAEIVRRIFEKYAPSEIRTMIDGAFATQKKALVEAFTEDAECRKRIEPLFEKAIADVKRDAWSGTKVTLKPEVAKKIDEHINQLTVSLLKAYGLQGEQMVQAAAEAAFVRVNEKAMANIDARINRKVEQITNAEIDRRVQVRLAAAMKG